MNRLWHLVRKSLVLGFADACSFALATWLTYLALKPNMTPRMWGFVAVEFVLSVLLFALWGLYNLPLRRVGIGDAIRIVLALVSDFAICALFVLLVLRYFPFFVLFMFFVLFGDMVLVSRFGWRLLVALRYIARSRAGYERVMVVGAGSAGTMIVREMQDSDKVKMIPVCIIDDDPNKLHTRVHGVPVVGDHNSIERMAQRYDVRRILVAIPSAGGEAIREICNICARTKARVQILPGVYQMLNDENVTVSQMRDVDINDLLGRDPVRINNKEVFGYIEGKTILVTGGGGSIGSELCRQIAAHNPRKLIIFDIYENNAYDIEMELRRTYPLLSLSALIGSVRDEQRVNAVFEAERPDIVFHAAAHKHVPLMEQSPHEAIKNNVFGTLNVARAADTYRAERFVMISTDKAVNPTNVMGATKRICEMIVQTFGRRSEHTEYVAVRFGNVLGSNGSVIPLFKKQIAEGGPVTVTHKDIIRYFMTIPEAVALVLQAGAYAKGGEIFVLDMGKPVKIVTLAENLIRLSGYRPYEDIKIVFTGLRPGEKLYEELLMDEEGLQSTANEKIRIGRPIGVDEEALFASLSELKTLLEDESTDIHPYIHRLVPTYRYIGAGGIPCDDISGKPYGGDPDAEKNDNENDKGEQS